MASHGAENQAQQAAIECLRGRIAELEAALAALVIDHAQAYAAEQQARRSAERAERQIRHDADRMRALSVRLVNAQEAERRALAHELHDEIGQLLTGLNMVLEAGPNETPDQLRAKLRTAQQVTIGLTGQVRQLSLDLRPTMLEDLGLLPTLLWHFHRYTTQTQITVDFKHSGLAIALPPHIAIVVYRIVQEGLTNVARYAQAASVSVQVWLRQGQLTIAIEDDGRGFDIATTLVTTRSIGLAGMRERAELLGGQLMIDSTPGEGTRLLATIPLDLASAEDLP